MGLELDSRMLRAYQRMAADLRRVFEDRFVALVAGRDGAAAAFAREIRTDDLEAMGALASTWHQEGLATPLLMTPGEFERSLDTFPGEYQALIDQHVVIDGVSPLTHARVPPDDLRRACEAQARGHLIHLRQGWIDESGDEHGLARLIERSAPPLRRVLMNLARLNGEALDGDATLAAFAERRAGLPASLITGILALERGHGASRAAASQALVPRLGEYLAASERLWSYIDAWRPH
ncbi:MAG TPA: hypothetical protein VFV78_11130 [Vicinamibacterales bacterium]|nr:hypothetical protein [Vicinamibacterales bacterium]